MVEQENAVNKWSSCSHSLVFGFTRDESSYPLCEEGYNENYGCEQPNIVGSNRYRKVKIFFPQISFLLTVATLHEIGKDTDESVIKALTDTCLNCPFYSKKAP